MASGKSTVGQRLAESLTWPFVDLDAVIESEANHRWSTDIPGLFERGEQVFRDLESECLMQILSEKTRPFVLSLGGGTLHNSDLPESILSQTTLFVLHTSWENVQERIQASGRPLKAMAKDLFVQRAAGYSVGTAIHVDNLSVEQIVQIILDELGNMEVLC